MLHLRVFESRDHKGEPIVVCSPAEDGDDGDGGEDQDGLVRIKQSATPQPPPKNMRIKLTNVNKKCRKLFFAITKNNIVFRPIFKGI